jgi:hypothetical protein
VRRRPSVTKLLDPDVVFYQSELLPWDSRGKRHEGVRSFPKDLTGSIESEVELDKLVDDGDRVDMVGALVGGYGTPTRSLTFPRCTFGGSGKVRRRSSRRTSIPRGYIRC